MAFGRFGLENVDEHLLTDRQLGARLVAIPRSAAAHQLPVGDHTLALAAEVDQDLIGIDADDGALDNIPLLETLHLFSGIVQELGHGRRLRTWFGSSLRLGSHRLICDRLGRGRWLGRRLWGLRRLSGGLCFRSNPLGLLLRVWPPLVPGLPAGR